MAIHFAQTEITFKLKNKQALKTWIKKVIEKEKLNLGEIAYTFCSDDELLKINQQFLEHDTYTDIITFDYREGKVVNGEIHISVDRVKENAEKFKTTF
jgi:probable rRNA maturation factor